MSHEHIHRISICAIGMVMMSAASTMCGQGRPEAVPDRTVTVVVDFGRDLGQNLGTLFEIVDDKGRTVAGAGFPGVYNTTCRNDRRALQFFVRSAADERLPQMETLPRFSRDTGVYVGDTNGRVHAVGQRVAPRAQAWNTTKRQWEVAPEYADASLRNGDGQMHLGDGLLTFRHNRI